MTLEVLNPGPMVSVQDRGRQGVKRFGVPQAGAMDPPAMALANALCGNTPEVAVLEFAGLGGRFRAGRALRFAVTGGRCDIRVGARTVEPEQSHTAEAGDIIHIGALQDATWGYLAISGGIAVTPVLGARATHLRFALGGLEGRALQAGDALPLGNDAPAAPCLRLPNAPDGDRNHPIRIVLGPQDGYFSRSVLDKLKNEAFAVSAQRDRMAMRLDGPALYATHGHDIVSDGIVAGAIQVPSSGQPMVLMADAQTTGGYPKIATVITPDLPRLAQLPTGATFRFTVISRDEAEDILLVERAHLRERLGALVPVIRTDLSSEFLLSCNLAGGITEPHAIMGQDLDPENAQ